MWRSSSYPRFLRLVAGRGGLALAFAGACLVASSLGAVTTTGCAASNCDTSPEANPAADFRGGILHAAEKVYETSAPDGLHLNFGAGSRYRIHHGLGGRPAIIQMWVSFSSGGVSGGNEAMPAGNMAEVLEANEEYVEVRNDSCGDYWLRVVLAAPVGPGVELGAAGSGGASGAAGGAGAAGVSAGGSAGNAGAGGSD